MSQHYFALKKIRGQFRNAYTYRVTGRISRKGIALFLGKGLIQTASKTATRTEAFKDRVSPSAGLKHPSWRKSKKRVRETWRRRPFFPPPPPFHSKHHPGEIGTRRPVWTPHFPIQGCIKKEVHIRWEKVSEVQDYLHGPFYFLFKRRSDHRGFSSKCKTFF